MSDVDVMEPAALVEVFAAIDCRRFGARLQVLAAIGAYPWGVTLSRSVAAKAWGMSEGAFREATKQLVDDRVIFRDQASGRRAHTYRVNPNVFEWANVPWRVDAEVVWHRVHSQLDPLAMFHGELDQPTTGERAPVAARAARATNARSRAGSGHFSAESGRSRAGSPRGYGTPTGASRAGSPRDKTSVAARAARAATAPNPLVSSSLYSGGGDGTLLAHSGAEAPRQPEGSDPPLTGDELRAIKALQDHTTPQRGERRPGVFGRSKAQLRSLVATYGADLVVEVCKTIPPGFGVPWALERHLEPELAHLAHRPDPDDVAAAEAARAQVEAEASAAAIEALRARRQALRSQLEAWAGNVDEDELEDLRAELATCETELANATTGGTQ